MKEPTEKQKIFCKEYAFDFNGSRAYKIAYPNTKDSTARTNASKLLTSANIQAYIEKHKSNLSKATGITAEKIIKALESFAFSDITETFQLSSKELKELPIDVRRLITSYKSIKKTYTDENGKKVTEELVELKFADKQKAFEMMTKMLGFNAPEKIIQVSMNHEVTTMTKDERQKLNNELEDEF